MPPHPDVFVRITHEVGKRVNDFLTVVDEDLARCAFQ